MALTREKKLTDATYSPTVASSEEAIRTQFDGSIQEVLDLVEANFTKNTGDHLGTWQGLRPTQAEPGLSATVEAHLADDAAHKPLFDAVKADMIAQKAISNGILRYGKITIQDDFPEITHILPFDLYRDSNGVIQHNFNIDNHISGITNNIYISASGSAAANGLTLETAVDTLATAISKAAGQSWTEFNVVLKEAMTGQNAFRGSFDLSGFNRVCIKPNTGVTKSYSSPSLQNYVWTQDGDSYTTSITVLLGVASITNADYRGIPLPLTSVGSKALCDSTENSYYYNTPNLWVHLKNDEVPNSATNILLIRDLAGATFTLGANTELIIKDFMQIQKGSVAGSQTSGIAINGVQGSKVVLDNVSGYGGYKNSVAITGVGESYLFDCTTAYAGWDGLNYHGNGGATPYEFVFEYNCHPYSNGNPGENIHNATTAHNGLTIVRVRSVGYDTVGPVLADVNGCYTLCYDCTMYDSKIVSALPTRAAFWFDENTAEKSGKAVLINCSGGGKNTYAINTDGNVPVYVQNFKGNNIPTGLVLNVIE